MSTIAWSRSLHVAHASRCSSKRASCASSSSPSQYASRSCGDAVKQAVRVMPFLPPCSPGRSGAAPGGLHAPAQPLAPAVTNDSDVAGREPELRRDGVGRSIVVERHDEHGALALGQRSETMAEPVGVERLARLL